MDTDLQWVHRLAHLEKAGERTELHIGPFTAWTLIGMIQLAARHPNFEGSPLMEIAHGFVDQFAPLFAGTPGEALIAKGWDPDFDRPRP